MAASRASTGRLSAPLKCRTGIIPIATPALSSEAIATRQAPMRSTHGPPIPISTAYGASSAKAMIPVSAALPVVVSTNHGIASIDIRVPSMEIPLAASSPIIPRRRLIRPPPGHRPPTPALGLRRRAVPGTGT